MSKDKVRLDLELVKREMAPSREKARALVMAGEVAVDGQIVIKSDKQVSRESKIEIKQRYPFVSRAAFKIQKAIDIFDIDPRGMKIVDIGISTGGFSDFLLKRGADSIIGIDVNIEQVDYKLRQNNRLKLLKKNARYLSRSDIRVDPDLITIDVSFISLTKIIPALKVFKQSSILALVKPQFEVEKSEVSRGGVIKNRSAIVRAIFKVKSIIEQTGFAVKGFTPAGLKGKKGNQEYFFLLVYGNKNAISDTIIDDEIAI